MPFSRFTDHRLLVAFTLAVVLAGTLWAYAPGLSGVFVLDDRTAISMNQHLASAKLDPRSLTEAALSLGGGLLSSRPLSMLTFYINHRFSGFDPYAYKLTNVFIHLVNGLLVFVLTRLILGIYGARFNGRLSPAHVQTMAVVITAAWLLDPINLTNVLYVVQRMNSLSALFTLLGLICYLRGRRRLSEGRGGKAVILTGFLVFGPLAFLCKENGALLPLYAFVLEICLFRLAGAGRSFVVGVFTVFLLAPLLALVSSLAIVPDWLLGGYPHRPFTLGERLLTEARALWFYLFIAFWPDIRYMGLYHDDFAVSHGLLTPWSTLPAVLGVFALAGAAFACRRRAPLVTLGILFFFAGHSMESTIIPLELVFEHRNYLPVYGVLLPAFYYLAYPFHRWNPFRLRHGVALLAIAAFTFATTVRASQWGGALSFNLAEVRHHPESPRANVELGRLFYTRVKEGAPDREKAFRLARRYFSRAALADKKNSSGLIGIILLYAYMDRPPPDGVVGMLAYRLRHTPFSNNDGNLLNRLIRCQEDKVCHLGKAALGKVVQAALNNKTATPRNRAAVLTAASRYFALYHDYSATLHFSRQAADALPGELQYRLNVVYWLITVGHLDQAQRLLEQLKAADSFGRHADYIAHQERRIRDARLIRDIDGNAGGREPKAPAKPAPPPAENN